MSDPPLIKGGLKGGLRGDRHPPYQGGQGGSNLKSIFNLIITSYLNIADFPITSTRSLKLSHQ
ncbi:hypothetical protein B1L04_08560 [Microcystis aeruginosa KW]|uniref:Uncharacterized protein n=1 Tax=Microcystis aeruginosa KW TaxID=1960155 RepID=A0A1V4BXY1_MICAE|nr:hypothetical protein B1L04_08560 [Microcystis aeruginosa KW]